MWWTSASTHMQWGHVEWTKAMAGRLCNRPFGAGHGGGRGGSIGWQAAAQQACVRLRRTGQVERSSFDRSLPLPGRYPCASPGSQNEHPYDVLRPKPPSGGHGGLTSGALQGARARRTTPATRRVWMISQCVGNAKLLFTSAIGHGTRQRRACQALSGSESSCCMSTSEQSLSACSSSSSSAAVFGVRNMEPSESPACAHPTR